MNFAASLATVYTTLAAASRPRDRLTVSEWADRHRIVTSEQSSIQGEWVTARNPVLSEIMDCLSKHSRVHEIVIKKSSQVGVTEAMVNALAYGMEHNPGPMMVLMPTEQKRDDWKAQKLDPLLRSTPIIAHLIGKMRSRDAAQRKDRIDFPGGSLLLAGGNSPASYDQVSIRDMFMDDLDRFPEVIGKGHDPVDRGRGRTKSFPHKYRLVLASTPTLKDASLIDREHANTDQREYHVPCPACGELQTLRWANLQYDKVNNPPRAAWYECAHCGAEIHEHHKAQMLAKGRWIAKQPDNPRRGYHINALYAPNGLGPTWLSLAVKWHEIHHEPGSGKSRAPEQAKLMSFINEDLGEVWEDQATALKAHDLAKRMDDVDMGVIPPGVLALTLGIDTQDDWLDVSLIGWRPWQDGRAGWTTIDWLQIRGDTATAAPWNELEAYVNTVWRNAYGKPLRPRAAGIDNRGHRGEHVKAFIQRATLQIPVYRLQGSTTLMEEFIAQTAKESQKGAQGKTVRGAYGIWNVGTEAIKDTIYAALTSDADLPPQERRIRFAAGLPTEYFNGMLAEVKNPKTRRYELKSGADFKRNEPLDGLTYAIAIGHHKEVMIGLRRTRLYRENGKSVMITVPDTRYWTRLAAQLEPESTGKDSLPVAAPETPAPDHLAAAGKMVTQPRPHVRRTGGIARR